MRPRDGSEVATPTAPTRGRSAVSQLLFMRHVKLSPAPEIDERALRGLIRTAYADIKRRLAAETDGAA